MTQEALQVSEVVNQLTKNQCVLDNLLKDGEYQHNNEIYQINLAETWHTLGVLQRELRYWEDCENALISSYTTYQKLGTNYVDRQAFVCFDLALLKSERQQWAEAEDYFRFAQDMFKSLGGNDVNSSLADKLADTWLHWGVLKRLQKQWLIAENLFKKAEQLFLRLGAAEDFSLYADELAETWMNIAIVWHAHHKTDKAQNLLVQAESLYLQLGANSFSSPHAEDLAETWLQLGLLLQNCRQEGLAKKKLQLADGLYSDLNAGQNNSPFSDELAETQLHLTLLYSDAEDWPEFNNTLQSALRLYANMTHFPGDFVDELTSLSSVATCSPIAVNVLFQQLSSLLSKWQVLQIGDDGLFQRTQVFWHFWFSFALEHNNYSLLLDIFGASHGQRLLEIVQGNLQTNSSNNIHSRKFLSLQQQLRQLELEILNLQQPLPSQTSPYLRQKKQRLKVSYRKVRKEWLELRQELVKQGNSQFIPLPILRATDLQACLRTNEAIVFVVALNLYGIDEAPRLLLVQKEQVDSVAIPMLNNAVSAMSGLNNSLISQGRSLSMRFPDISETLNETSNNISFDIYLTDLQAAMKQYQKVLADLLSPNIRSIHIVSQGPFHGLPWQYACSVPTTAFYPGLHSFWQRRHNNHADQAVYPNEDCPLCLLSNGCDDDPQNRLYFLPVEIEMISLIWGKGRVETPVALPNKDGKPRLLFLLGHGSFHNGDAQFCLSQAKLNPQDFITYPNPLYALGTSACLLASHQDIATEAFGLFSLTASRPDIKFSVGAIVPVDDFWTTCLSLLFHYYWRELGKPNDAMRLATETLASGQWPEEAKVIFKKVLLIQLPTIFNELQNDIAQSPVTIQNQLHQRADNIIQPWTRHTAFYIQHYKVLLDIHSDDISREQSTEILVDGFFENLIDKQYGLDRFIPFWLWG